VARRGVWILVGLAVLGFSVAGVVWATWPAPPPPTDWSQEYDTAVRPPQTSSLPTDLPATYDLTSRPADSIPPGTIVEKSAPPGWTHLIIKSLPRVRESEKHGIPELTVEKAAWMFTAFLADVTRETANGRTRYRFNKAALGLGAKAKGRDTILTPETGRKLGGDLGLFGGEILTKGYEVQRKAVLVFSGSTMALLDTPVWFRCGDDNRLLRYRYALLVDPRTGRLETVMWRLGADANTPAGFDEAVILKPNTIDVAELVIDRKKVNRFGVPGDDAFAVDGMPAGRPAPIPAALRALAGQTRFTADEARTLDTELRKLLK
jgi:hypothetical protein